MAARISTIVSAETSDFQNGMQRAKRHNDGFLESVMKADKTLAKMARIGGVGLSTITAGLNAMEAASKGSEVNILSLGTSMLSAFAMGGPVGLGVAALGTVIGLLAGDTDELAEAQKRASAATQQLGKDLTKTAEQVEEKAAKAMAEYLESVGGPEAEQLLKRRQTKEDRSKLREDVKTTADAMEKAQKEIKDLTAAMEDMSVSPVEAVNQLEFLNSQLKALQENADKAKRTLDMFETTQLLERATEKRKGTEGGEESGAVSRASKKAKAGAKYADVLAATPSQAGGEVPDMAGEMGKATEALSKWAPGLQKLADAVTKHAKEAADQVTKLGTVTANTADKLAKGAADLAAKLRAIEQRMDRAGASTGAAGA